MNDNIPLVSVLMLTYNHAPYIAQAIDSVLLQKTNFPYELLIGEDCSTDGTGAIVEKYAHKYPSFIRVISGSENIGALGNIVRITSAARGKYMATLEGDDFWSDQSKLQKQVDFLEQNPEYGLAHSDVNQFYEISKIVIENFNAKNNILIPEGDIFNELLDPEKYIIKTPTALFRKNLHDRYVEYNVIKEKGWGVADLFTWLSMARFTKVKYFPHALATYRVLPESAGSSRDLRKKLSMHQSVYGIRLHFIEKYGCPDAIRKKVSAFYVAALSRDASKLKDNTIAEWVSNYARDQRVHLGIKSKIYLLHAKHCCRPKDR
jgi:glycosyltransferase involved in cell wall biosynthesis